MLMSVQNIDIARILNRTADLLEIEDANIYRVRAYRNAARTVADLQRPVAEMVEAGEALTDIPDVGDSMAEKIREIVRTGSLEQFHSIKQRRGPHLDSLMKISGLGPKRVKALNKELGIRTLKELKAAAEAGRIRDLEGFGEKIEQTILKDLDKTQDRSERIRRMEADQRAEALIEYLSAAKDVDTVTIAGSFRRRKATVGDLDILVVCRQGKRLMRHLLDSEDVREVISSGETRSSVVMYPNLQVDVRVVAPESYGAALHYFTGSKAHNVAIRRRARKKGLKINEYGVFRDKKRIAGETEESVYASVSLPWIPPELREDRGEMETAAENALPTLVRMEDIQGDLHAHTRATDGRGSLDQMAAAARKRGYGYLAITEHSQNIRVANGMDAGRLRQHLERIDRINASFTDKFVLLKGVEVDILKDGRLDLEDEILADLDLCICAVHFPHGLSADRQTERILKAMDNPHVHILAHPTGRLIHRRQPYAVHMETLLDGAAERGCHMELNAHPDRLDLNDVHCRMARQRGVKIAISTDAHNPNHLEFMKFGIDQARRGWLEAEDVLNTKPVDALKKMLRRS